MATPWKYMLIGSVALSLAACEQEAGASLDEGGFGNPTMHNMLAQACTGLGKGYKLGAISDPVVALNPDSAPRRPVYVRKTAADCQDRLNGKYAQIIFTEYVNSAVPIPLGNELTAIETN